MARKRMLDPHIWESAYDKGWSSDDFAVMVAAMSAADDEGKGRVSMIIRNVSEMVSDRKLKKSLGKLKDSIVIYRKIYFFLPNFLEYQKISHPQESKIPKPTALEIKTYLENLPESFTESIPNSGLQVKLSKVNISKVKVSEMNVDNSNENPEPPQTSNSDFPLPLLTEITDYEPNDYEDKEKVTQSVKSLLTSFCNIENPDKATVTSFVNIVTNTKQVKNKTAFKYVFDTFNEFNSYSEEKRNLKYLYSRVKGRIDDALILGREENAKTVKGIEKLESSAVDNKDITQLASKMEFK